MAKLEKCWGRGGGVKSLGGGGGGGGEASLKQNRFNLYHTTIFQVCAFTFFTEATITNKKKAFEVNAKMKNVGLTKTLQKYRNKRWYYLS